MTAAGGPAGPAGTRGAGRPRITRARTVLLTVLAAAVVFVTTTQTWVHATLTSGTVRSIEAAVNGSDAARSVTALALVALAGALAISIAGRIARIVVAAIIVLAGIGCALAAVAVLADPGAAANGQIAARSGVTGGTISASVTGWVTVAVVAAVLLAACGILVLMAGPRWDAARRFETPATAPDDGPAAPVDTSDEARRTAASGHGDDIDSWDSLTRGQDPTA
ncbi:hypothetical protein GCM10011512_14920 [Tersicoccus solisilvae]|uniref:Membrane protein (TIGR02234 family) n=1 Tax=Tersicoccus solisilvae TaxID=1882339 RepID=A0ABQ1P2H6_9MICC|nr:Trp biosynthesis-associated membrane protein [Tersicoccus solisilvae]GGC89029.1 hypothetical protein GCM10011512_14920 [Tersicoccus solisilvae]